VTQAFDIDREPAGVRDQYGRHLFGQSLLLARRLVQAGVPIVQANMGIVQTWDTHDNNFVKLKDRLLPPLDRGSQCIERKRKALAGGIDGADVVHVRLTIPIAFPAKWAPVRRGKHATKPRQ